MSGVLLAVSAFLFDADSLNATTQTLMWVVIFFFASAGASAAYLTVSETWPIEIRSEAIAVFFAIGTIAGALGPAFYGALIGDGTDRTGLFIGYLVGAGIMIARRGRRVADRDQRRRQVARGHHQTAHRCGPASSGRVRGRQQQDRPDQEADRPDERPEVRQLGVPDVAGRRHDVGGHGRDAEGDGAEHVRGADPPVRGSGLPVGQVAWASIQASPLATRNATEPRASGRHTRWSALGGVEVQAHGVARAPVEPQRAGELHRAGEPGDVPRGPHPEAAPRRRCSRREAVDRLAVLQERGGR